MSAFILAKSEISKYYKAKGFTLYLADCIDFLAKFDKASVAMIFADPPYNINLVKKTLIIISQYDILSPSGLLIIEHSARESVPEVEGDLSLYKQKTYKKISVSIYRKK